MQACDRWRLEAGAVSPRLFDVHIPLRDSLKLIRHGEFAASHLPPERRVPRLTGDVKVVSCIREPRSSLTSEARFAASTRGKGAALADAIGARGLVGFIVTYGKRHICRAREVAGWQAQPNGIVLKFEELKGDPQQGVGRLAGFLGVEGCDPAAVLAAARAGQSLTKSTRFVDLTWGEAEAAAFRRIGGPEANAALGYPG